MSKPRKSDRTVIARSRDFTIHASVKGSFKCAYIAEPTLFIEHNASGAIHQLISLEPVDGEDSTVRACYLSDARSGKQGKFNIEFAMPDKVKELLHAADHVTRDHQDMDQVKRYMDQAFPLDVDLVLKHHLYPDMIVRASGFDDWAHHIPMREFINIHYQTVYRSAGITLGYDTTSRYDAPFVKRLEPHIPLTSHTLLLSVCFQTLSWHLALQSEELLLGFSVEQVCL